MYKVNKEQYKKLIHDNVTKEYKHTTENELNSINIEAKKIAEKLKLEHKIECMAKKDAFITIKDHKENFQNNTKCRLINPAKSEIGIVSSHELKEINNKLRSELGINQWRNSDDTINWFKKINGNNKVDFHSCEPRSMSNENP